MDIDLLSRILKELVTDHDMVGLPGIGTFVTEVVPASFSDKGYTINPPYRRLSFVQGRIEDQLLIEFYAESNEVSVEAAEAYITQFLREMKEVLKERKIILLPGLGRLRATKENNFFFVPEEDLDIFPDGFALKPVSLKNIQREMEPVTIPVSFADAVQSLMEKNKVEPEPEQVHEPEPQPEQEAEPQPQPLRELVPLDPEQVPYSGADIPLDPQAMQEPETEPEPEPEQQPDPELVQSAQPVQPEPEQPETEPAQPEAQPQPEPEPEAQPEQQPEPEQLKIEPAQPETEPEQPEPEPEPQPEQTQAEPEQQPNPEPTPEPEQVQVDPEPTAEPEQQPQAEPEQAKPEPGQQTRPRRRWWIAVLVVVALLAVALGVFIILAHAAPDFIDSILYTPEELRIINA